MQAKGPLGEAIAGRYLVRRGWQVIARNWRGGGGELDIVALRNGLVAFVEVKTRAERAALDEPVRSAQRQRVARAALAFLAGHPELGRASARFDVIAVDTGRRWRRVRHVAGAFQTPVELVAPSSNRRSSGYATERNERR